MNHHTDGAQVLPKASLVSPAVARDLAVIAARSINLDDVLDVLVLVPLREGQTLAVQPPSLCPRGAGQCRL